MVGKGDNKVEISHLFFVDDTLVFCQPHERMILNLKCVLLSFQAVYGLNIELNKSELVKLAAVLGCKRVKLSIKYFVPL